MGRAGKQGGAAESPVQVILGIGVAARKSWAAVTEHRGNDCRVCAVIEKIPRYPLISDAPVGRGIAREDVQAVQAVPIQGPECRASKAGGRIPTRSIWR